MLLSEFLDYDLGTKRHPLTVKISSVQERNLEALADALVTDKSTLVREAINKLLRQEIENGVLQNEPVYKHDLQ